jgi:hypothetical protein
MTVRVQDERGAPLPGVQVWAWSTRRVEGFGDDVDLTELQGIATTHADGQVSFRVHRPRGAFFIAEKAGWPAQINDGGAIVLGPSRSVKGHVRLEAPCKTSFIPVGAYPQWWNLKGVPASSSPSATTDQDGNFELPGLGPGAYAVWTRPCREGGSSSQVFRMADATPIEVSLDQTWCDRACTKWHAPDQKE